MQIHANRNYVFFFHFIMSNHHHISGPSDWIIRRRNIHWSRRNNKFSTKWGKKINLFSEWQLHSVFFGVTYSESMIYRQGNGLDTIAECLLAPRLSPPALSDGCTARRFDMPQQDTEGPAIKCKYRTLWMSSYAHWCTFIVTVAPNIQISSDVSCTCSQSASWEQKAKHELHIEINRLFLWPTEINSNDSFSESLLTLVVLWPCNTASCSYQHSVSSLK